MAELLLNNRHTLQKVGEDFFLKRDGQFCVCPVKAPISQFNKIVNAVETQIQPCSYLCALASITQKDEKIFFIQRCGAGNAIVIEEVSADVKKETPLLKI